jgi:hypothetical protein
MCGNESMQKTADMEKIKRNNHEIKKAESFKYLVSKTVRRNYRKNKNGG